MNGIPRDELEAITTYWHNGKPAVVRHWKHRESAKQYVKMMKKAKKRVSIQEYFPV